MGSVMLFFILLLVSFLTARSYRGEVGRGGYSSDFCFPVPGKGGGVLLLRAGMRFCLLSMVLFLAAGASEDGGSGRGKLFFGGFLFRVCVFLVHKIFFVRYVLLLWRAEIVSTCTKKSRVFIMASC